MPGLQMLFNHLYFSIWFLVIFAFLGVFAHWFFHTKSLQTFAAVIFASFIAGGWLAFLTVRSDHGNYWTKACYANMRVVMGAIELYNMDRLHPPLLFASQPLQFDQIATGSFSKSQPSCGNNDYLKGGILPGNYFLVPDGNGPASTSGKVVCSLHGPE